MVSNEENRIDFIKTEKLLDDTFIDILSTKPLHKISVKEITTKANLSRGTFYLHYEDKYSILEKIEETMLRELLMVNSTFYKFNFFNHDSNEPFPYFEETYIWVLNNKKYLKALLGTYGNPNFTLKWKSYISDYFMRTFENNGVYIKNKDIVSVMVSSMLMDAIIYWIHKREDISPSELSIIVGKAIKGVISSVG